MAHDIQITTILDGARNGAYHVFITSDGISNDLIDEIIIDPAELTPELKNKPALTITGIKADLAGFDAILSFNYLATNTPIWSISRDQTAEMCFDDIGGLKDRSAMDGNGKLLISTKDLTSGYAGTIIIKFRKD